MCVRERIVVVVLRGDNILDIVATHDTIEILRFKIFHHVF